MIGIESPDPARCSGVQEYFYLNDRIFVSGPSWRLAVMSVSAELLESLEALEMREVSDHAALLVALRHRPPPDPDSLPIPKHIPAREIQRVRKRDDGTDRLRFPFAPSAARPVQGHSQGRFQR
eukprot:3149354-Pyramimonas_sp.AAC.1